jgi:hypothetical protein
MEAAKKPKYCFDTDTLASSWRRHYRLEAFGPLWERLGTMMADGSILIPEEVKKEIGAGKDGLVAWLKTNCPNCLPIDDKQLEIVSEIVNKYPGVSHYKKPRANHADPFVVAVGKIYSITVVTFESGGGGPTNPSIPALCKEYGVGCCTMADFFDKEKLSFTIKS